MSVRSLTPVRAYGVGLLAVLAATLIRVAVDPWLGKSVPFLLFFPAIMIAARYGGFGPGIMVTALSASTAVVFYLEPLGMLALRQPADLLSVVLFAAIGVLIARLSDTVRAAEADQWQLAAIVASSDDAIVGKNLNGNVQSWNRGAERLFGYSAAEAIGRPITLIIPAERLAEEHEVLRKIRAGERIEPFETVRRRKDGTEVEVSVTVSPVCDGSGAIVGISKIARDITDRRRVERQRAELVERQRLANDEAVAARDRLAFLSEVSALLSSSLELRGHAASRRPPRAAAARRLLQRAGRADERGELQHVAWGHVDRAREPLLQSSARDCSTPRPATSIPTFADRVMQTSQTMVASNRLLREAVARLAVAAAGGDRRARRSAASVRVCRRAASRARPRRRRDVVRHDRCRSRGANTRRPT